MRNQSNKAKISLVLIVLCAIIMSIFAGCFKVNESGASAVKLSDLKKCTIDDAVFELSKEDLDSVIVTMFSSMDMSIDPETITDSDVEVFGYKTVNEYKKATIETIMNHRVVETYYDYLMETSEVEFIGETEDFKNMMLNNLTAFAAGENKTCDDLVRELYNIGIEDMAEYLYQLWAKMQIIHAYCDEHHVNASENEIRETDQMLKDSEEFQLYASDDEARMQLALFFTLDEKVRTHIAETHEDEIKTRTDVIAAMLICDD